MRTSRAVLLGAILILLVLAGASAVWLWEPWNPVSWRNYERVNHGMMRAEVEAIFGRSVRAGPLGFGVGGSDVWVEEWEGSGNRMIVVYTKDGRVDGSEFCFANPPTLRQRVQKWLGLIPND